MSGPGLVRRRADGWLARACLAAVTVALALAACPRRRVRRRPPYQFPVVAPGGEAVAGGRRERAVHAGRARPDRTARAEQPADARPDRQRVQAAARRAERRLPQRRPGQRADGHEPEHRADLLDRRAGRPEHVGPERARLHRADDADGPGRAFDLGLANAWGQTEGTESRAFMVTGMFGPQTDLDRLPNWGRNLTTGGEDPYLTGRMVAAQINGMQGSGAMSRDEALRRLQRPEPEHQHRHRRPGAARELPDAVRVRVRRRPRRGHDVLLPDLPRHLDAPADERVLAHPGQPVRRGPDPADLEPRRVALLLRAAADPQLRPARPLALAGVRRLRLPGDALDLRDPPGRGPGDADADRLLQRRHAPTRPTDPTGSTCADGHGRQPGEGRLHAPGASHVGGIPGPELPGERLQARRRRR